MSASPRRAPASFPTTACSAGCCEGCGAGAGPACFAANLLETNPRPRNYPGKADKRMFSWRGDFFMASSPARIFVPQRERLVPEAVLVPIPFIVPAIWAGGHEFGQIRQRWLGRAAARFPRALSGSHPAYGAKPRHSFRTSQFGFGWPAMPFPTLHSIPRRWR